MSDLSTPQAVIVAIALCIAIPLLVWYLRRSEKHRAAQAKVTLSELEEKQAEARQTQLRKGTHDAYGHRLCITCNDKFTRATETPFIIKANDGVLDLVRRWFGAPTRYSIEQVEESETTPKVYCEQCAAAVFAEHELKLLRHEQKLRELKVETSVEHRRWVKVGVNDVVATRIEKHDEHQLQLDPKPKRATVVAINGANGG